MKAPFTYFGAKSTIADQIVALLPAHAHYVEPYAGSLAVLLAKPPTKMETVNDLDGDLISFWQVLRDRPDELARACALTPHSRAEYQTCRREPAVEDPLEQARRVWVLLTQGRGGTLGKLTGWRHFVNPRGSSIGMPGYLDGYINRIAAAAERLHHVSLECLPALDIITKYGGDPDILLYVDPPYLGTARNGDDQYRHEMKDEASHRELADALNLCTASVVLSGYGSPLYDQDLYRHWHRIEIATMTGNGGGTRGLERTEVLWSNRPIGIQPSLFDFGGAA